MSFILSQKSLRRLEGVNPDLVKVVKRAIQTTPIDFIVVEAHQLMARICEQRHGTHINLSCGDCQAKMYNIINSLLDTYENGK